MIDYEQIRNDNHFEEFIDQLIDYPINCASITQNYVQKWKLIANVLVWIRLPNNECQQQQEYSAIQGKAFACVLNFWTQSW